MAPQAARSPRRYRSTSRAQVRGPRTDGAWHCSPLRFDLAWHLDAWCIGSISAST
jgi:hypothetical protein